MQQFGINPGDRVGIALPNGPELGILLLSVCARACACPVNPQSTAGEIVQDLGEVRTKCLIVLAGGSNDHLVEAASTMGVPLLTVIPSDTECGIFSLVSATGGKIAGGSRATVPGSVMTINPGISTDRFNASAWTAPDQHALVLHTSGTSGKKKIVPYSLRTMVVGSACIVKSWMLTQDDINLNMMPLFHIGGIARNVFSPVLSGGGVVLCPGFDPSLFWDTAEDMQCTWYYASPTMHQGYVEEATRRLADTSRTPAIKIRFIANAAGALLPALAQQMKKTFDCAILPGYGMTECMPISAPPIDYNLDRKGTSGRAVGPELKILDGNGVEAPAGEQGNICVRGFPVFQGYEDNPEANATAYLAGDWFNTGDLGYMDKDGYLYINGQCCLKSGNPLPTGNLLEGAAGGASPTPPLPRATTQPASGLPVR